MWKFRDRTQAEGAGARVDAAGLRIDATRDAGAAAAAGDRCRGGGGRGRRGARRGRRRWRRGSPRAGALGCRWGRRLGTDASASVRGEGGAGRPRAHHRQRGLHDATDRKLAGDDRAREARDPEAHRREERAEAGELQGPVRQGWHLARRVLGLGDVERAVGGIRERERTRRTLTRSTVS